MNNKSHVAEEYSRLATIYDDKWAFYIAATIRETIARMPLNPADKILDVGCGTGELLHQLAATHSPGNLFGADPVAEMLAVAQNKVSAEVSLCEGWAENLPFDDAHFDVVVSCNMFHYIQQPTAALQEMWRVLRPGGRLIITDWCDDYLACRLCSSYLRLVGRAHFKTYRQGEFLQMLKAAGYAINALDTYKINWLWGLMTAQAKKSE
ncbi:MAG: class I SAM-dependent methyltransferase [Gammaproteobacteria bacterium WSBS_2016_MAG_OTU1]